MIFSKYVKKVPEWVSLSEVNFITLSGLLIATQSPDIRQISVRLLEDREVAFIVLAHKKKPKRFLYFWTHRQDWLTFEHVIITPPDDCPCWCCEWRRRRSRFVDIKVYQHLFECPK